MEYELKIVGECSEKEAIKLQDKIAEYINKKDLNFWTFLNPLEEI